MKLSLKLKCQVSGPVGAKPCSTLNKGGGGPWTDWISGHDKRLTANSARTAGAKFTSLTHSLNSLKAVFCFKSVAKYISGHALSLLLKKKSRSFCKSGKSMNMFKTKGNTHTEDLLFKGNEKTGFFLPHHDCYQHLHPFLFRFQHKT